MDGQITQEYVWTCHRCGGARALGCGWLNTTRGPYCLPTGQTCSVSVPVVPLCTCTQYAGYPAVVPARNHRRSLLATASRLSSNSRYHSILVCLVRRSPILQNGCAAFHNVSLIVKIPQLRFSLGFKANHRSHDLLSPPPPLVVVRLDRST